MATEETGVAGDTIILTPREKRNAASCKANERMESTDLSPYGTRAVSPRYTMSSSGRRRESAETTVSPPSPESKTPMGLLSALCDTSIPFHQCGDDVLQHGPAALVQFHPELRSLHMPLSRRAAKSSISRRERLCGCAAQLRRKVCTAVRDIPSAEWKSAARRSPADRPSMRPITFA